MQRLTLKIADQLEAAFLLVGERQRHRIDGAAFVARV